MSIDQRRANAVVDAALDCGINFFDTAASYSDGASEVMLGESIRGRRDSAVIATKFGDSLRGLPDIPPGRPDQVRVALDAALLRLGVDFVDVFYYHMPDGVTPIEETLGAMQELVEAGKTRALGCSNFSAPQLEYASNVAGASGAPGFVAIQNQYGLLERDAERDVLPLARELNVGFIPYMPLANGLLTGKYRRGHAPPAGSRLNYFTSIGVGGELLGDDRFDAVQRLAQFAQERNRTLLELAIAVPASTPGVASVLVGATSPGQVRANAAAAQWRPDVDLLDAVPRAESLGMNFGFRAGDARA